MAKPKKQRNQRPKVVGTSTPVDPMKEVLGKALRKKDVVELAFTIAELCVAYKRDDNSRVEWLLESLRLTLSQCSERTEILAFVPAIQQHLSTVMHHQALKKDTPIIRTETLTEYLSRGGTITKPQSRQPLSKDAAACITLESLGL